MRTSSHSNAGLSRLVLAVLLFLQLAMAQNSDTCTIPDTNEIGVQGVDKDPYTGDLVCLPINRQPALYTGAFGDCLGGSQLEITRFSAAYYKDNMTLSFELEGNTNLTGSPIMMYIAVFAYGENRFEYLWDPCGSSSQNICPLNNTRPFYSTTVIPLGPVDVQNIPALALSIPDFEGQAIMRIFSNQTQNEIACYSATITNGITFSQPAAVGTIVGLFVATAMAASFLTAVYGEDIAEMRLHYAHSMSVWVIFAVLQHVFFTGALSVNWPAVLPAFWSNFAWAAGMIRSDSMQRSLSHFAGNEYGNTTFVGAAETGSSSDGTAGGYSKSQIYSRALQAFTRAPATLGDAIRAVEQHHRHTNNIFTKRDDNGDTFTWFGKPVTPGLPLPGNYSGFAGTLSIEDIAASNAFMTGFVWFIILLVILIASTVGFKWLLEGFSRMNWIKRNRLGFFRSNYLLYTKQIVLRACFIAFFMFMFLTMFQFSYHGAPGPVAIASLVFIFFLVGGIALAYVVFRERTRHGCFVRSSDRLHLETVLALPPLLFTLESRRPRNAKSLMSIPWIVIQYHPDDAQQEGVHEDEYYIKKFGWLTARFRADGWWFFAFWMAYDFFRACFLGGAAGHPLTQVFALLVIEFIAFFAMVKIKPFEGNRLNTLMVWLLGLSKIITTALSSAFDPAFNLGRILTTALGIIIIVIQSLLLIAMLILIVIGAASSYMSMMRYREQFYPEHWRPAKNAYFRHLDGSSMKSKGEVEQEEAGILTGEGDADIKPYFKVGSIRRIPKIEESDNTKAPSQDPYGSLISLHGNASPISGTTPLPPPPGVHTRRTSRALSSYSGNLPFGARASRTASWSSHDVVWSNFETRPGSGHGNVPGISLPQMPKLPDGLRSRDSLAEPNMDAGGYQITPTRARTSTMRSVSSTARIELTGLAPGKNTMADEIPLEVLKARKRTSTTSEVSSLAPNGTNRTRGPSPLGTINPVTATTDKAQESTTATTTFFESEPTSTAGGGASVKKTTEITTIRNVEIRDADEIRETS